MRCMAMEGTVKVSTSLASLQLQGRAREPQCVNLKGSVAAPLFAGSESRKLRGRLTMMFIDRQQMKRASQLGRATAAAVVVPAPVPAVGKATKNAAMFRISEKFAELKERQQVAFIPYLTAGDPNLETTIAAAKLLESCGADIIEIGIPHSDPLADGPVIQASANRAISGGTNLDSVINLCKVADFRVPIVLFIYYNALLKRGMQKFLAEAKAAGVSGGVVGLAADGHPGLHHCKALKDESLGHFSLIVPDLPIEETGKLRKLTAAAGLELVLLTTPTTPTLRMTTIAEESQGFVYLVSRTGVTGTSDTIQDGVKGLLKEVKKVSDKPVAVGFGVSTHEQAAKLAEWGADGVIIGSAIVKLLGESGSPEAGLKAVKEFAIKVRSALPPVDVPLFPLE